MGRVGSGRIQKKSTRVQLCAKGREGDRLDSTMRSRGASLAPPVESGAKPYPPIFFKF